MYKKDCFAYKTFATGSAYCSALYELECEGCKFYKQHANQGNAEQKNTDVRQLIKNNGLMFKQVARQMGINEKYLTILLQRNLTKRKREMIYKAIKELGGKIE